MTIEAITVFGRADPCDSERAGERDKDDERCRRHGITPAKTYVWRKKLGGIEASGYGFIGYNRRALKATCYAHFPIYARRPVEKGV
jgi:hypothetical protein